MPKKAACARGCFVLFHILQTEIKQKRSCKIKANLKITRLVKLLKDQKKKKQIEKLTHDKVQTLQLVILPRSIVDE